MDSFATRLSALEGSYFRVEEKQALERHLAKLVDEGKISSEVLESLQQRAQGGAAPGIPTEVRGRPQGEYIYQHKKGGLPTPNLPSIRHWSLGTPISMGRGRWTADGVSIFDVQAGKELAQTSRPQATMLEMRRAQAIQRAALATPLVQGYRWYPEMTPGRALFWGTLLAVAGTAVGSKIACIVLDIKGVDDIAVKINESFSPMTEKASSIFKPLGAAMSSAGDESAKRSGALGEFAEKIKQNMQSH